MTDFGIRSFPTTEEKLTNTEAAGQGPSGSNTNADAEPVDLSMTKPDVNDENKEGQQGGVDVVIKIDNLDDVSKKIDGPDAGVEVEITGES
jgi:hypothetical protein